MKMPIPHVEQPLEPVVVILSHFLNKFEPSSCYLLVRYGFVLMYDFPHYVKELTQIDFVVLVSLNTLQIEQVLHQAIRLVLF